MDTDVTDLELIANYGSKEKDRTAAWKKLAKIYVTSHNLEDAVNVSKNSDAPWDARIVAGMGAVEMIIRDGSVEGEDYGKLLLLADDTSMPYPVRKTAAVQFVEGSYYKKHGNLNNIIIRALENEEISAGCREIAGRRYVELLVKDRSSFVLKLLYDSKAPIAVKETAKKALANYADNLAKS